MREQNDRLKKVENLSPLKQQGLSEVISIEQKSFVEDKVAQNPQNASKEQLIRAYLQQGNVSAALSTYQDIENVDNFRLDTCLELDDTLTQQSLFYRARIIYKSLASRDKSPEVIFHKIAHCNEKEGRQEEALSNYIHALIANPLFNSAYYRFTALHQYHPHIKLPAQALNELRNKCQQLEIIGKI